MLYRECISDNVHLFECNILPFQEPPCRICTHLSPPAAFNPRSLESRYKSPVTRRREYCEPRRCNAKVGTDLKYEFNSRSYNVDRAANKIQEPKRNVQGFDRPSCGTNEIRQESSTSSFQLPVKINELKDAHNAVTACLREMEKVRTFLEDENSWWKILKGRSVDCCQQKLPHLHGVLDGSSVTLMLLEEGTDEVPRRFVTSMPKEKSNVSSSRFGASSRELTSEPKQTEYANHRTEHTDEYADSYTTPHYSLDMKSALIEVTSHDSHEPTQRYVKRAVASEQSIVTSEFSKEIQEDRTDERNAPKRSHRSKETHDNVQYEDRNNGMDRSNIVPPREIRCGQNIQTTYEDALKSREAFSSENTGSKKHIRNDFESNVDLSTELPSRNVPSHKPRTKTIIEKSVRCIQNLPTKISKTKGRD
ncbi:uncharacterized protein LOC143896068 [Temnothorax americanus]|uniref:uncharacterized protein LOC143896068 n=1 Tax=Temnothorax americanus TaxID=1964332 RepID=UPI0040695B65